MTKHLARTAAALAASCFVAAAACAADDTARIRNVVDSAIRPMMAEYDLPGMAVGVTAGGKSYVFNYGVASKEKNIPVSDATLFEMGSVSKPMAATLASYAQVLGKLSLDDHPGKYMPELKGTPIDKASLLHLGTYTAGGLPQQFPDNLSDKQMVAYFQKWKPDASPGAQRRYSNPSFGLFGHLTALALKADFSDAMEQQLFAGLGMKSAFIRIPESARANYAWGYNGANKPVRMKGGALFQPSYGVVSTAADVLRLVEANIDPTRLPGTMRRAIEGTQVGHFAVGPMVQGLGWEQYPYPGLANIVAGNSPAITSEPNAARRIAAPTVSTQAILFNKTGATGGFSTYVAFVPQQKIGIVMLANKFYPSSARVSAAHAILVQLAPAGK